MRAGFRVGNVTYILQTDAAVFWGEMERVTKELAAATAGAELSALRASVTSVSDVNLAKIGPVAPKGRVQDRDYNDLPVVDSLLQRGKESIPFLISKLDDETTIHSHVFDYWSEVRVGDVALVILTDFFLDSSWQKTTIPGVGWNDLLEGGSDRSLTGEQVLRNYISKHGRKAIKERWQKIWVEYRDRLSWDENERCFKVN
jgi:hypothetical protein